jgi:hypothetical protein
MSNEMQLRQQVLQAAKTILDQAALLAIDAESPTCQETMGNRVQLILQVAMELDELPGRTDSISSSREPLPDYRHCLEAAAEVVCRTCIFNGSGICPHTPLPVIN